MPEMVTSTYQNLVRNILALVLGTLKIFTRATRKCRLKGKIVLCGGGVECVIFQENVLKTTRAP